jgi:hypothetical protein
MTLPFCSPFHPKFETILSPAKGKATYFSRMGDEKLGVVLKLDLF